MNVLDKKKTTEISEIFSSRQGEGVYLGKKQIFIRFGRCNMHCTYCDELPKMNSHAYSDVALTAICDKIIAMQFELGRHHSVSLTGGEPLFYDSFLTSLLPQIKSFGLKTYLETNGTLPTLLKKHLDNLDYIAMDFKPPSSTQDKEFWSEHREFLKLSSDSEAEVFTKLVVTEKTTAEDVKQCIDIQESIDASIPFVFQPESLDTGIDVKATQLIENYFHDMATKKLSDVRIIPQMHKVWGIR